ncbi:MAG: right-handed parallel beta-helix repeat-containing protein [Candidatus Thermoplasmatota archaeon]|nr:right-handed parallel beta-helix repeat-containing protein [Candidatus Thermoplasmatota archaeon]
MQVEKVLLIVMTVTILLGSTVLVNIPAGGESVQAEEPTEFTEQTSSYIVNYGEVKSINNEQWIMKANIEVNSGGTLYINGTDIMWGGTTDGQYGLYVKAGGTLYINHDCNFTANDVSTVVEVSGGIPWSKTWGIHWKFDIRGKARVENCELSYMWGANGNSLSSARGGIQCYSDDILIQNVSIFNTEQSAISTVSDTEDTLGGYDPIINNVYVQNVTGWALFAGGAGSSPTVTNLTLRGSGYRGAQYFYGATGRFDNVDLRGCPDLAMTFDPINYASMTLNDCVFADAKFGYSARRGGAVTLNNCDMFGNSNFGIELAHDTAYTQTVVVNGGMVKDNGMDGIGSSFESCPATISGVEIAYNGGNGVNIPVDDQVDVSLFDCKIYGNAGYGIYDQGSGGAVSSCRIYDNVLGNVQVDTGDTLMLSGNIINSTTANGVTLLEDASPTITMNEIYGTDIGLLAGARCSSLIANNKFNNNRIGARIQGNRIEMDSNEFTSNTEIGLHLDETGTFPLRKSTFDQNAIGLLIEGGHYIEIKNVSFKRSTNTAISAIAGANFSLMEAVMQSNNMDVKLNGASIAKVFEIALPMNLVSIADSKSELWQFWRVTLTVADNVTLQPIDLAEVVVYSSTGDIIERSFTIFDGSFSGHVPSYRIVGQTTYDYNPVTITVDKDGYVPYSGGSENLEGNIERSILLSENRPPLFPIPPGHTPEATHQKRPTLNWSEAWDWNSDIINYNVNVYMDDLYTGEHLVVDQVVDISEYTFVKNLRYNRIYWVEITSFDPWGLSDSIIFSFETVNTPPTTPVIDLLNRPVSTRDDITVVILNGSTDVDTDPVDDIVYLVDWYAFKENSWVLLSSGLNLMTLPSDRTHEGEDIKVVVKAYDGISYGESTELTTNIVNFVPEVLIEYVDITINEDEEGYDLIELISYFNDRDGDDLSYRVKSQRHVQVVIDQVTNAVSFIPDPNWVGDDKVVIEAFDTKVHEEGWPTVTINVTVVSVNDVPTIDLVNQKAVGFGETVLIQGVQGSTAVITMDASDVDEIFGDTWTFSTDFLDKVGEIPESDFQFEINSGHLSVFLSNALVGEHLFNITVTDSNDASSTVSIRLVVDNTNDEMTDPVISSPADSANLVQEKGERIRFEAEDCYDPDFDIPNSDERLTYEWYFSDGEEITNAGNVVEHRFGVTGNYTIRLVVKDTFGVQKDTTIRIFVTVKEDTIPFNQEGETGDTGTMTLIIILIIVAVIFLAVLLFFVFRKDPLARTAEAEEQAHEALVAQQQQDALAAQEQLQALLSGVAYPGVSGPALPSATGAGQELEALPAAPTEAYIGQEPPMEPQPEPVGDEQPQVEPQQEPPEIQPAPEPVEPVPMQAAPAGTVPKPEAPPSQDNHPSP